MKSAKISSSSNNDPKKTHCKALFIKSQKLSNNTKSFGGEGKISSLNLTNKTRCVIHNGLVINLISKIEIV
jgi:hypothetical protein